MRKKRYLAIGLSIGIIIGSCTSAFAADGIQEIRAYINDSFQFKVNGEVTYLDEEYHILVYNNRTYLPVRGLGEVIGAKIDWNDSSKTVLIDTSEINKDNTSNINTPSDIIDTTLCRKIPQSIESLDYLITATQLIEDDVKGDRLYISLKNKTEDKILRLQQGKTELEIDGYKYTYKDIDGVFYDSRWYTTILEHDEVAEGYIRLPQKIRNYKELKVTVYLTWDGSSEDIPITFNIFFNE